MESKLAMMFGGRIAEELIFGPEHVTTGAGGDIQQATSMARRMVTEFGMSDKLGRVRYNANEQEVFLGHSVTQTQNVSEITANLNASGRRATFIKMRSQIEVLGQDDAAALTSALPRLVDLFTVYLREMRPEELRGSAGTHRLREELIARANIAAHPARVTDVLFQEILMQ
jgi:flagellar basal body-associated protein FliL